MEIITCHYKEDITWLKESPYPVNVIHKEGGDIPSIDITYTCPNDNKGDEAVAYLKFIIKRYNTLPDHCVFLHGHEHAHHHQYDKSLLELIECANIEKYDYITLNNSWRFQTVSNLENLQWRPNNKLLLALLDNNIPSENLVYDANGQFIVSKQYILKNTLEFYKILYDRLLDETYNGYMFEECWHLLFTHKLIDPPFSDKFNFKYKIKFDLGMCNITLIHYYKHNQFS